MKKEPLTIPITISTGHFESGDPSKDDRIRLDQTSYYLSSIFWCLDNAAKSYDLLEGESEIRLFTFPEFRGHVQSLCELGNALAERLTVYSLAIKDGDNRTLSTAEMISSLITDETVPDEISEALSEAVTDMFNRLPLESAARKIDSSPEYIETVLSSYSEVSKND